MTSNQEYINRVIRVCTENREIVCGDDGFYVYWPTCNKGSLTEHDLRIIANHLAKLNEPWIKQIDECFTQERNDANEINF